MKKNVVKMILMATLISGLSVSCSDSSSDAVDVVNSTGVSVNEVRNILYNNDDNTPWFVSSYVADGTDITADYAPYYYFFNTVGYFDISHRPTDVTYPGTFIVENADGSTNNAADSNEIEITIQADSTAPEIFQEFSGVWTVRDVDNNTISLMRSTAQGTSYLTLQQRI